MHPKKMNNLVGKTFNFWTVLEARPENKKGMVLAKCVCGIQKIVRGRSLVGNVSKSCGCIRSPKSGRQRNGKNQAATSIYSSLRGRARNKNLGFEITFDNFLLLSKQNCYYCGQEPMNKQSKDIFTFTYNGIDRVDNSKGYTLDNILVCCYDCNTKKGAITKEMIYKLYNWFEENKNA